MVRFLSYQALVSAVAIVLAYVSLGASLEWSGFAYGITVFWINIFILSALVRWGVRAIGTKGLPTAVPKSRLREFFRMALVGGAFLAKLGFVGISAYLGLVVWNLPTLSFMIGSLVALILAAALASWTVSWSANPA